MDLLIEVVFWFVLAVVMGLMLLGLMATVFAGSIELAAQLMEEAPWRVVLTASAVLLALIGVALVLLR